MVNFCFLRIADIFNSTVHRRYVTSGFVLSCRAMLADSQPKIFNISIMHDGQNNVGLVLPTADWRRIGVFTIHRPRRGQLQAIKKAT